jgi:hypothetical protein
MPALSKQFLFKLGTTSTVLQPDMTYGHFTGTSVSIPSITYSGEGTLTFKSQPEKGAGYYGASAGFHTVSYTVTPNFVGTLTTQATLATTPTEADWFNVDNSTVIYPDLPAPIATTTTNFVNFTGNFVWVRALVQRNPLMPNGSVQVVNYNF